MLQRCTPLGDVAHWPGVAGDVVDVAQEGRVRVPGLRRPAQLETLLAIPGALLSSLVTVALLRWGLEHLLAPAGVTGAQVTRGWMLPGTALLMALGLTWGAGRLVKGRAALSGWALENVVVPLAVGTPPFLVALVAGRWGRGDSLVDQLPPAFALALAPVALALASGGHLGALAAGAALAGALGGVLGMLAPVEVAFGRAGWGAVLADPAAAPGALPRLLGGLAVLNVAGRLISRWLSALAALAQVAGSAGGEPKAPRLWTGACLALVLVVLVGSLLAPLAVREGWRPLAQAWRALVWRPLLAALLALLPGLALGLAAGVLARRRQVTGSRGALGGAVRPDLWWGGLVSELVLLPAEAVAAVPALALLLALQNTTQLRLELLLALVLWPRCARVAKALAADRMHLRQVALVTFTIVAGASTLWFAALQFLGRTSSPPLVTVATSPQGLASAAPLLLLACVPWLLLAGALSQRSREALAEVYR